MSQTVDRTQPVAVREREAGSGHQRLLDQVIERTLSSGFDAEAFHVMDQRDTRLIQDEILGGAKSSKFIYDFKIQTTQITGISAVGARELATHYRGIRHRLISSTRKLGALYVFTTYPNRETPGSMHTVHIPELADEPDGYEAVCEVEDIKTGLTMQAAKFEAQWEWSNNSSKYFEKPHFATIAQAKAQRNGILMVIPQSVQLQWMESLRGTDKKEVITAGVLQEKRDGVLRFAASKGITVKRDVLETLLLEQIMGLSEAARTKDDQAFQVALIALGLVELRTDAEKVEETPTKRKRAANPPKQTDAKPPTNAPAGEEDWRADPTGEKKAAAQGQRQQANHQQEAPRQEQQPAAAEEGFEAWLVDENGSEVRAEPYTNPMTFAGALAELCAGKDAETVELIFDQNGGAMADAREVEAAAKIMDAIQPSMELDPNEGAAEETAKEDAPQPMELPVSPKNGAPEWEHYIASAKAKLDMLGTPALVTDWMEINRPTFVAKSMKAETMIERHAKKRLGDLAGEPAQTVDDRDDKILASIAKALKDCPDKATVDSYKKMDGIRNVRARLEHEGKADYIEKLDKLFADREAEFG